MSQQNDTSETFALGLVGLIVTAVVGSVLAWAVVHRPQAQPSLNPAAQVQQTGQQTRQQTGPQASMRSQTITFEAGQANLPESAQEPLGAISRQARSLLGSHVQVVPFQAPDQPGDESQKQQALARGQSVRHGLEANGVDPKHIHITKPMIVPQASSPKARQVELSLQ